VHLRDDLRQVVAHRAHRMQQAVLVVVFGVDVHRQVAGGDLAGDLGGLGRLAAQLAGDAARDQQRGDDAGDQRQGADDQHHHAGAGISRFGRFGAFDILLFLDRDQLAHQFPPLLLHWAEFIAQQLVGLVLFAVERQRGGALNERRRLFGLLFDLVEQLLFVGRRALQRAEHLAQLVLRRRVFLLLLGDAVDFDLDFLGFLQQDQVAQRQRALGDGQVHGLGQPGFHIVHFGDFIHPVLDLPHAGQAQPDHHHQEHGDQAETDAQPRCNCQIPESSYALLKA
jgi:hypothetical protein